MWAYPTALITLGLFTMYQAYQFITNPHAALAIVTVLNVGIMYLIYREWQQARAKKVQVEG